ncbi:unnamed protein product [Closterium sp. NIES-64]|nr:unnamed protein product [Closterium sp. NIES-64]
MGKPKPRTSTTKAGKGKAEPNRRGSKPAVRPTSTTAPRRLVQGSPSSAAPPSPQRPAASSTKAGWQHAHVTALNAADQAPTPVAPGQSPRSQRAARRDEAAQQADTPPTDFRAHRERQQRQQVRQPAGESTTPHMVLGSHAPQETTVGARSGGEQAVLLERAEQPLRQRELTATGKKKAEELPAEQTGTVARVATTKVATAATEPAEEDGTAEGRTVAPTIAENAGEAEEGGTDGEYGGTTAADAVAETHECAQGGSDTPAGASHHGDHAEEAHHAGCETTGKRIRVQPAPRRLGRAWHLVPRGPSGDGICKSTVSHQGVRAAGRPQGVEAGANLKPNRLRLDHNHRHE